MTEKITMSVTVSKDLMDRIAEELRTSLTGSMTKSPEETLWHLITASVGDINGDDQEEMMETLKVKAGSTKPACPKTVKVVTFEDHVCAVCRNQAGVDAWMKAYKKELDFAEDEEIEGFTIQDCEMS